MLSDRPTAGTTQDYPGPIISARVLQWLQKAAEEGNAAAQMDLGWVYADGRDVPRDDAEAAKWFRKAAEQGEAAAQNKLGVMYANGRGVSRR